jgi:hypothetical protein
MKIPAFFRCGCGRRAVAALGLWMLLSLSLSGSAGAAVPDPPPPVYGPIHYYEAKEPAQGAAVWEGRVSGGRRPYLMACAMVTISPTPCSTMWGR